MNVPTHLPEDPVLLVGDPGLRQTSEIVSDFADADFRKDARRVARALARFRATYGFGRAIAAPQIGIRRRMIALALPHWHDAPFVMVNPALTWASDERFTLWDDCMSFPFLLVKVSRHRSISLTYQTVDGEPVERRALDLADAELLQHEMDHLDLSLIHI